MGIIDYSNLSERELEKIQSDIGNGTGELRVFIADILPRDVSGRENMQDRMIELENLVNTFGGVVILEHIQNRTLPDYNTYIGGGKLEEMISEMQLQNANLLIIGNILKPHQIYKINELLKPYGMVAWDRVDLILKIFQRNAKTTESKLQIELAAIKHMGPRIFNMGMELGKQSGKGSGETNTEIMKRHLAKRESDIKKDLQKYANVRKNHREGRQKKGYMTVGIVGYTNAGKSSLMNALTQKGVLAEDKLFATLGTSVGKMWIAPREQPLSHFDKPSEQENGDAHSVIPAKAGINKKGKVSGHPDRFLPSQEGRGTEEGQKHNTQDMDSSSLHSSEGHNQIQDYTYQPGTEVLLSDTIGFIRDLPPELVDAFASTLEDSIESDILFHVVDASDPKIDEKIEVVDSILHRIGATQTKIYIFNKIDALSLEELSDIKQRFQDKNPIFVSAQFRRGFDSIEEIMLEYS